MKITMTKWHNRWLELAGSIAQWSKDPSTKVGAVLFTPENTPVAFGYNGLPRGLEDSDSRLQNRELKYKLTVHAEANALMNALRSGAAVSGNCLAVTTVPCPNCAAMIIQAGIKQVIFNSPTEDYISRWDIETPLMMFKEAGVSVIQL